MKPYYYHTITFDTSVKEKILNIFNMKVDRQGYIRDERGKLVHDCYFDKPVKLEQFAGVKRSKAGNTDIFCSDISSIIQFADEDSRDGDPDKVGGTDW